MMKGRRQKDAAPVLEHQDGRAEQVGTHTDSASSLPKERGDFKMEFNFDHASHEAQHIVRFMEMAQECLAQIQPISGNKQDYLESLYSLTQISGRIAQGLMKQMDDYV